MARLRDGEWIAGAGGVALLAAMFLHWYGAGPFEVTAWQAFDVLDILLALLALVPLGLVVTQATRRSPSIPVALSLLTTLAGMLAALLILYRVVNQPGPNDVVEVEAGAWLGFVAAVVIAAGGWRSMRVEPIPGAPLPPIEDLPAPAP
jgi:prepilin signal peptidase PulO-like enzyme (type II secretory pathway)